jgi:hypothetical protein
MPRFLAIPAALIAAPAAAHDAGGIFHLHPHGSEAVLIGLALVAGLGVWLLLRRR